MSRFVHLLRYVVPTVGLVSNLWALHCVVVSLPLPGFGGHFQFLTILGLLVATLAFFLKVVRLFVPGAFDSMHEMVVNIATPVEGLITVLYWPMVLYNRDLLASPDVAFILPLRLDLSLHFWPAVFLWVDFLAFNVEFKRTWRHIVVIYSFAILYYFWTSYCYSRNQFWVYPFLAEFSDTGRMLFFIACATLCTLMYEAGAYIHAKIHHATVGVIKKD
ncbi:FAR-17a/AIG1-like protein-domain-containing protein [Radiomyces spectabilis]|uniref:FAR-17a/AIG1-like protein-domain-containing protein n=1 Tax=Radiomyces spectabilis TaxID=64574 RepID=UPI00221EB62B|nr:FAR-17a/AIG1-like protein-domain-containing protein [Radiomyces spectabilis]KAI8391632.1 FAR-17a/AIG1-like protein-domain-containing protein [Radiomyces spectabilis]